MLNQVVGQIRAIFDLGGPVVILLIVVSVITLTVVIYKLWQFSAAHVGRHTALNEATAAWHKGDRVAGRAALSRSGSYLVPIVEATFDTDATHQDRIQAMAEERFSKLEGGFRFLDSVAQLAPLLGLFGTVLGMIDAFQALQDAGSQVDPSILAGGIWVALLTTAVGLGVAMPTAVVLSWFESRMEAERVLADRLILTALAPASTTKTPVGDATMPSRHA